MGFGFDVAGVENGSQIQAKNSIVAVLKLESCGLMLQVNTQISVVGGALIFLFILDFFMLPFITSVAKLPARGAATVCQDLRAGREVVGNDCQDSI